MAKALPDETRAAVLAALLAGQSVSAVARTYHIDRATVISWRTAAHMDTTHSVPQEKGAAIGELVIAHVQSSLRALEAIATAASQPPWLEKQSAENIAVLYGVIADKTHRLLAALESEPESGAAADA